MIIINADDFGLNQSVNSAVIESFKKGICSSTTIMPNMPGFEEACELSIGNKLSNHIGLHLVLIDGYPLTEKIKYLPKFCDREGRLSLTRFKPTIILNYSEKEALAAEIRAQIKRCRDYGINITHVDSHHHTHIEWGVASVLIPILREYSIPFLRIPRINRASSDKFSLIYKYAFYYRLKRLNHARTRSCGSISDYISSRNSSENAMDNESFEIMIHPTLDNNNVLVDSIDEKPLEESIKAVELYPDAVSFKGLKYKFDH